MTDEIRTYLISGGENIQAPYYWHYFDPVAEQRRGCCEVLRELIYGPRFFGQLPGGSGDEWRGTCVGKGLMSWDTHPANQNDWRCYITDEGREYLAKCEAEWKKSRG